MTELTDTRDRFREMLERQRILRESPDYVPPPKSTPLSRFQAKSTPRRAITLFCCHCMGYELDGTGKVPVQDVRDCTATNCPLYHYRPYR